MRTIEVTRDFAFAEAGIYVTEYTAGQVVEVSDDCADCAIREKWAKPSKKAPDPVVEEAAPETVAAEGAPETTAAESAPETK